MTKLSAVVLAVIIFRCCTLNFPTPLFRRTKFFPPFRFWRELVLGAHSTPNVTRFSISFVDICYIIKYDITMFRESFNY